MGWGWASGSRSASDQGRPNRVYVICGDGEMGRLQLEALQACLSSAALESDGDHRSEWRPERRPTSRSCRNRPRGSALMFGFEALEVDGHDLGAAPPGVGRLPPGRPRALIARTQKGAGSDVPRQGPALRGSSRPSSSGVRSRRWEGPVKRPLPGRCGSLELPRKTGCERIPSYPTGRSSACARPHADQEPRLVLLEADLGGGGRSLRRPAREPLPQPWASARPR